ncbi:putative recombinase [Escherichia coli]|nr:putative recombinase [Escherichia coli]
MSFPCRIHQNASPCYPLRRGWILQHALPEKNGHFHGATPAYLLAPEVSALLFYMPDQRHHMLFATLWNTGMRIGEARMLTPESFDLDGVRPFVRILSEKVRARRGRPPKDEVRLVPLTDISYVRQMESWMITTRPGVVNHYGQ